MGSIVNKTDMEPIHKSAAIVVIGDEILKGRTVDTNSPFIAKHLFCAGVRVCRIIVVPDNIDEISDELRSSHQRFDFVITCGGIGPTHDDVTYEGVAKAMNVPLKFNPKMAKAISKIFKSKDSQKIATLPEGADLLPCADFPVVRVGSIYILPGIPVWCESGFLAILPLFTQSSNKFVMQDVKLAADEWCLLPAINETVKKFEGIVTLGSYPSISEDGVISTKITFDSSNFEAVYDARVYFMSQLPAELQNVDFTEEDAKKVLNLSYGCSSIFLTVDKSVKIVIQSLEKYSLDEVILCFNGGKDCTALLHLVWAVITSRRSGKLHVLYIRSENPFLELVEFVNECTNRYQFEMEEFSGPIKPALERLLTKQPQVKAVWMGTRNTDPYSQNLKPFQMCDPGWPRIERISPLLHWSYHDVWTFLRQFGVPYCKLYDEGYTSLGDRGNTVKNPALLDYTTNTFRPAYSLRDSTLERKGRK